MPSAFIELIFAYCFGFSPFIIFALMMSMIKVAAIRFGRKLLPKLMVQHGALQALELYISENGVTELDLSGKTLLHYFVENGAWNAKIGRAQQMDVLQLLLARNANVHIQDRAGKSPLDYAMTGTNDEVRTVLLGSKGVEINDTIRRAIGQSSLETIMTVIEFGERKGMFQPDACSIFDGKTALHSAASVDMYSTDLVLVLLTKKATVNASDQSSSSPLHEAAMAGHTDIAKMLVAHGANLQARNSNGRTAMQITAVRPTVDFGEKWW